MDPYVGISDDFQVYVKPQSEIKDYGSAYEEALSTLAELRDKAYESDKDVFAILVESLSTITKVFSLKVRTSFSCAHTIILLPSLPTLFEEKGL